ncbi:kinesin-like protein KIF9 isoform X2 [Histomonas meleagridis]|uniref:kinesin-like protein KIF9 isoform X2 n=1 Tax=Histomonas meleagridis TaxID=135588 RepID=UPI00355984F5|nr:kinesin-like protein KIF9 isoform X2 [Histomonas meleagridis]KAH0804118.1 kinesin-like protein KIF9 isoform X2 [Histomonas meleagridis]
MKQKKNVLIRVKPTEDFAEEYITIGEDEQSITVKSLKKRPRSFLKHQISSYSFQFGSILQNTDQQGLFLITNKQALDDLINGISSCIICNGGPSSGKTYTLNGPYNDYQNRGLIPRSISYIFQKITTQPEIKIKVRCSYIELWNEQLFDVLNAFNGQEPRELKIVESSDGSISVKNLFSPIITDEQSGLERLFMGNAFRNINPNHLQTTCVFTLWLDSDVPQPSTKQPLHSKLNFVDMASPVKFNTLDRENAEFHRQASINRTNTVLERVLIAEDHIPYRSCPLTHFLKDSLPNRTIISHVSFATADLPSTISTLKFAARMQGETSDDILNLKEHKQNHIKRLQKEIDEIRSQLRAKTPAISYTEPDRQEKQALSDTVTSFLSDAIQQFPIRSLYEVRAALEIMKEKYRAQKVAAEEQLREKYIFTAKQTENDDVTHVETNLTINDDSDGLAVFPLMPTQEELWKIFKNSEGSEISEEIMNQKEEVSEVKKRKREIAIIVNEHKSEIDKLRGKLEDKEKSRLPPINGVPVIDEDELMIRKDLKYAKQCYKDAYAEYENCLNREKELLTQIKENEEILKEKFEEWNKEKQNVENMEKKEEEEEMEEPLDKEERKERKEYQELIEKEPKAGPYFYAIKKIEKILEREFRANGTRKHPVSE